jgi:hypothetical protein
VLAVGRAIRAEVPIQEDGDGACVVCVLNYIKKLTLYTSPNLLLNIRVFRTKNKKGRASLQKSI